MLKSHTKPSVGSEIASKLKALRNWEPTMLDVREYVLAKAEPLAKPRARKTEVTESFMAEDD